MVISFAASSQGPLQPNKKLSYPDIYTGIPSILLCIEMAFFAILHVFAFNWKPYSLKHGAAAYTSSSNSLENGAAATIPINSRRYRGFWYAIFDAFNPWDVVKASARGLRWMFVRYKHRHNDSSYAPAPTYKLSTSNEMDGHEPTPGSGPMLKPQASQVRPPHLNTSLAASSLQPHNGAPAEDDTAGLLGHSAQPGQSTSPISPARSFNDEFSHGDDGAAAGLDLGTAGRIPPGSALDGPSENAWHDTSYAGAHPAALQPGARNPEWEQQHAQRRGSFDGAASTKPPSYKTVESRGWI